MFFKMRKRMVLELIFLFLTLKTAAPRSFPGDSSFSLEDTNVHSDHEKGDAKLIQDDETIVICKDKLLIEEFVSEGGEIHCLKYKCLEKGAEEGLCNFMFAISNYLKVKEDVQTAPPRMYQGIPHKYTMQMKEAQIDAIRFLLDLEMTVEQAQTSNEIHENVQIDNCNIKKYCQPKSYEFYFSIYDIIISVIFILYIVISCMHCETRQLIPIHKVADIYDMAPWYRTGRRPSPYWTFCTTYNYGIEFDNYMIMKQFLKDTVTIPFKVIKYSRNKINSLRAKYRNLMD